MESLQGHSTLYQQSAPRRERQGCSLTSEKAQQPQALCSHPHTVLTRTRHVPKGCRFITSSDQIQKADTTIYFTNEETEAQGSSPSRSRSHVRKGADLDLRLVCLWPVHSEASLRAWHTSLQLKKKTLPQMLSVLPVQAAPSGRSLPSASSDVLIRFGAATGI